MVCREPQEKPDSFRRCPSVSNCSIEFVEDSGTTYSCSSLVGKHRYM